MINTYVSMLGNLVAALQVTVRPIDIVTDTMNVRTIAMATSITSNKPIKFIL